MWEENDVKQLYLVLKVSCRWTDNLQPGTTIIKNLQYNGILNVTSFMQGSLSQISLSLVASREINQIVGGSDPLRWLNFEICESEPCINDVILRIPLYCKFLMIVVPG